MSNCYEFSINRNSGYYLKENKLEKYKSHSTNTLCSPLGLGLHSTELLLPERKVRWTEQLNSKYLHLGSCSVPHLRRREHPRFINALVERYNKSWRIHKKSPVFIHKLHIWHQNGYVSPCLLYKHNSLHRRDRVGRNT